jgi:hypothetical protein
MNKIISQIAAPRVPIVDPATGLITREWYRFINSMYEQLGAGTGAASGTFTTADSKTVTVVNGIITGIV